MNDFSIGVLGGMGTYATLHLFRQYTEVFPARKEWERPRLIIDNRCTMPSRVRAFLLHENIDTLVSEMTDSLRRLLDAGCTKIILDCNTSHLFLPRIFKQLPALEDKLVNIIDTCVSAVRQTGIKRVFILGTEGTIESKIYQHGLSEAGIEAVAPEPGEYAKIRSCIEAVKQNVFGSGVRENFLELINRHNNCILGCTELPILLEKFRPDVVCPNVFDPLWLALQSIHEAFRASRLGHSPGI